jgi:type II secretory pathway pseudopilin PulG
MKIKKYKLKNLSSSGYTLIEMLAVIILIIIVGTIITGIITMALRGNNRSRNINEIRQTGDFAIVQMQKMVAYADRFNGVARTTDVDQETNIIYTQQCVDSNIQYNFLRIKSFDEGSTTFICSSAGNDSLLASYSGSLLKWPISQGDTTSLVSFFDTAKYTITACYFKCIQNSAAEYPQIDINFTLTTKSQSTLIENKVIIPFKTTVSFRNGIK